MMNAQYNGGGKHGSGLEFHCDGLTAAAAAKFSATRHSESCPCHCVLLRCFRSTDLLRFGEINPEFPPRRKFLSVAEVVCHLLAGIARHQRGAVLQKLLVPARLYSAGGSHA